MVSYLGRTASVLVFILSGTVLEWSSLCLVLLRSLPQFQRRPYLRGHFFSGLLPYRKDLFPLLKDMPNGVLGKSNPEKFQLQFEVYCGEVLSPLGSPTLSPVTAGQAVRLLTSCESPWGQLKLILSL